MGPYRDFSGGVLPGYGGSKAALEHLTSSAAYELARHNIAVNALSPSEADDDTRIVLLPNGFRRSRV